MKPATKNRIIESAKSQIAAGDYHALRLNSDGRLVAPHPCHGWSQPFTLPQDLLTPEMVVILNAAAEKRAAENKAACERLRAERLAQEEEFNKLGPIFLLLAGENTDIVQSGTFTDCISNLWKVCRCPRDYYAGKGAWTIVRTDTHDSVRTGYFDRDTYWEH